MDPRKRRKLIGRLVYIGLGLVLAGLLVLGFLPKPVPVTVGKVAKRPLTVTVDESGRTRIRHRYVVSSPVLGSLARISLDPGDAVRADDVVARIAPVAPGLLDQRSRAEASARVSVAQANVLRARAGVHRAEAALQFSREQAQRLRSLNKSGGATEQALEQAEFELRAAEEDHEAALFAVRVAENELAVAKTAIASTEPGHAEGEPILLRAPVSGDVLKVMQQSEGVVQPGTPLLEIGDPGALEIVVDVLTTDAVDIQKGAPAAITRWGGDEVLHAVVREKEPSAFTTHSALGVEEQRVSVLLDFVEPADKLTALSDNYRIEAHIQTAKRDATLVVPASALFRAAGGFACFVVRDERAVQVEVAVGLRTPELAEVKKGLRTNDVVVLYPSDQVADGVRVAPQAERRK